MEELNERQRKVYEYMSGYIRSNGYPPTVREICTSLGIKSTSTVHKTISELEELDYLVKQAGTRRTIKLTESDSSPDRQAAPEERSDITDVPIVGQIAAGTPILAEQNIEDTMPIPSRFVGKGNSFMLRVHGDSMIEAGIFDGDYILVREQKTAENGQIVAAMIEDYDCEATVKGFYKENGHVRLQPYNSSMEPIIVDDVRILGLVKGVFRYFN